MPLDVVIDLSSFDGGRIAGGLRSLGKESRDLRSVWKKLLPILAQELGAAVRSEGAAIGQRWPQLAADTLARKRRLGRGRAALIGTGRLLSQLTSPSRAKASLTKRRLKVGPRERYMFVMHYGSKRRGIPARPFVAWTMRGRRSAVDLVSRFIDDLVQRTQAIVGGA